MHILCSSYSAASSKGKIKIHSNKHLKLQYSPPFSTHSQHNQTSFFFLFPFVPKMININNSLKLTSSYLILYPASPKHLIDLCQFYHPHHPSNHLFGNCLPVFVQILISFSAHFHTLPPNSFPPFLQSLQIL